MILYSALPPLFENAENVSESFFEIQNGSPVFYGTDTDGKRVLKFSTDPKMYLERGKPLH